jgi:hypothetical protein
VKRIIAVLSAATVAVVLMSAMALPALASDHLANATGPGFIPNPVGGNPSGISGDKALPETVPGEGNPAAGNDHELPAVDLSDVFQRSGFHANP